MINNGLNIEMPSDDAFKIDEKENVDRLEKDS